MFSALANHPTIAFDLDVEPELEVDADPDQLFRVIMNLCRNAAQALEADTDPAIVRRIGLHASRGGTIVVIRISDTGPAFRIGRVKISSRRSRGVRRGGTGLGLAICAELVRLHGGTIELLDVSSGAAFEITIPDRVIELKRGRRLG